MVDVNIISGAMTYIQLHLCLQINEFVKRARAAKIHAYIISHLKKEMPAMMGKAKTQQRLIDKLEDEFGKVLSLSISFCLSTVSLSAIQIISIISILYFGEIGPKGIPLTSRGFSKC